MTNKTHIIDGVTYREVDRKAEVGDKVIGVLCEYYSEKYDGYSIGKVYEVTAIKEAGSDVCYYVNDKFKGGDPLWLVSEEYRVLEPVQVCDGCGNITEKLEWISSSGESFCTAACADNADEGPPPADMVESPPHYNAGRFEVIDVIEDAVKGADGFEGACVANILKYTMRYRHKNGLEDVKKAAWYLARLERYLTERDGVK